MKKRLCLARAKAKKSSREDSKGEETAVKKLRRELEECIIEKNARKRAQWRIEVSLGMFVLKILIY